MPTRVTAVYWYVTTLTHTPFAEFERNLEEDFQNETSGNFKRLLVSQCNAGRDENEDVDDDKAREDAQEMYDVSQTTLTQHSLDKPANLRFYKS